MRTNIEIDDELMKKALEASGSSTKKGAVDAALQMMVRLHGQTKIRRLRGKVHWEGNLKQSREGRLIDR